MDVARATYGLGGTRFARLAWVDETGSTNDDLVAAAKRGEPEQALGAEHQTAGKGRLDRRWEAEPSASILCSVLVRPAASFDPHLVTTALALAAAGAVEATTGVRLGVKWPNDLVAGTAADPDDRKVAGVLAESVLDGGTVAAVVAGIGLNVARPAVDGAASLEELAGGPVDRADVVAGMLRRLGELVDGLPDIAPLLRTEVAARSATLGRTVRVERTAGDLVGVAIGLGSDGQLLVSSDDETVEVHVGDVIHLRPTD